MSNRVSMITLFLGLLIWVSLASADYFMVEPTGELVTVERVGDTFKPINKSKYIETTPTSMDPGFIDSIYYFIPGGGYYYPNRDSNTIVMTWVTPYYPCSLVAVRFDFYSPGHAELYIWDAPEYEDIGSTEEMFDTLDATWQFECDTAGPGNWVSWPTVLYGPVLVGSDEPGDKETRTVTHELSPHLYVGTDDFYCGYRIITRTNPAGEPWGGKPWSLSDAAAEDGVRVIDPCRGWMYRVQYTHPTHCSWVDYGLDPGMWDMKFIVDIVPRPPISLYVDQLTDTYSTDHRFITAYLALSAAHPCCPASKILLIYWLNSGAPDTLDMVPISQDSIIYAVDIPGQPPWDTVNYYAYAEDFEGHSYTSYTHSYIIREGTPGNWLFVEQGNAYYGVLYDPIAANCTNFDLWAYGTPDSSVINFYTPGKGAGLPLMYFTGWDLAWVANAQDEIASALDNGAALVLCSQDGLHTWWPDSGYTATITCSPGEFLYDYLKMVSFIDDFTGYSPPDWLDSTVTFYGETTDPISGSFADGILTSFACWAGSGYFWPGAITEFSSDATGIFRYENGEISGYRYEDAAKGYKIVYLYWHPDYVISEWCAADTHTQDTLISNILKWFGVVGVEEVTSLAINLYSLSQNIPNPTSSTTSISYKLPKSSHVSLKIYDITGRLVKTLVDQKVEAGNHIVCWDTKDNAGLTVAPGVYFYKLNVANYTATKKIIVMR